MSYQLVSLHKLKKRSILKVDEHRITGGKKKL